MKLSELYKSLSDNQRFNFWTGTTNLFLCLFTFWAGLTLQFAVVDKATNYQSKLLYQEYDTKVTPKYLSLLKAEQNILLLYSQADIDKMIEMKKDLSSFKKKSFYKELNMEKIQSLINVSPKLICNYDSIIRPSIETIINNAIDLRYVLPENEKKKIEEKSRDVLMSDAIYYALSNSKSQEELYSKIDDFFKSEKYTKNTRLALNGITRDRIIESATKMYNNANDITKLYPSLPINELFYNLMLSQIIGESIEIYKIYNNELGFDKQISLRNKLTSWWNNCSLLKKSITILFCTFIGGMVIFIMFFKILCSQKTKRRPTREEYNDMKKNINNLQDQIEAFETDIDRLEHEIIRLGNPGNIPLKNKINYK